MAKTTTLYGPYRPPKIPTQKQAEAQKQKAQKNSKKK